ncbi:MAG: DUF4124 domain-containing protein [Pseudoxanthomonas sp.]
MRHRPTDARDVARFAAAVQSDTLAAMPAPVPKDQSMRLTMLLLLLSTSASVQAQQVYKCVGTTGVAYQSQPCLPSQRTLKQWEAAPDPPSPAKVEAAASSKGKPALKPARRSRAPSRSPRQRADPAEARCNAAKARRASKLEAVGLKRTFDLMRKLDDAVHLACR